MRTRSKVAVDSYSKVFTCSGIREGLSIDEKGPVHWHLANLHYEAFGD